MWYIQYNLVLKHYVAAALAPSSWYTLARDTTFHRTLSTIAYCTFVVLYPAVASGIMPTPDTSICNTIPAIDPCHTATRRGFGYSYTLSTCCSRYAKAAVHRIQHVVRHCTPCLSSMWLSTLVRREVRSISMSGRENSCDIVQQLGKRLVVFVDSSADFVGIHLVDRETGTNPI